MKYQLREFNRNIPDGELLTDLKAVADRLCKNSISSREYNDSDSKYTSGTIAARFGSWNNALQKAGLELVHQREVSTEELFKNLEQVWLTIGQQPTSRDMKKPASKYSIHQYISKFDTWVNSINNFIEFMNYNKLTKPNDISDSEQDIKSVKNELAIFKHKTKRFPSERLKVQVLMRDGNRCRLCGITLTGDRIHFDHIKPWSKGGETILENLQILCDTHNLAKGNLDYEP